MILRKDKDYQKLKGWKYRTIREARLQTDFRPSRDLVSLHGWVALRADGLMFIKKGYCWDGASGPTFDTASTMRASLYHDALYQLMREGKLHPEKDRRMADELLRDLMIADGAWPWRADLWLWAVWRCAARAARKRENSQ